MADATGHGAPCPIWCTAGPDVPRRRGDLASVRRRHVTCSVTAIQGRPRLADRHQQHGPPAREISDRGHPFTAHFYGRLIWARRSIRPAFVFAGGHRNLCAFSRCDYVHAIWTGRRGQGEPVLSGRVAHGYLLLSLCAGLFVQNPTRTCCWAKRMDNLRFWHVRRAIGIKVRLSVKAKTPRMMIR